MNNQFTWLHIGLGSFHRAHQAWYLHRLIASGDNRWRIAAGNIRNDAEQVVQALAAQGGRYVLETVSPEGEREYEEITSIQKLLPWQAGLQPLINEGANPQTKVIAFTVTEGGYYLNTRHRLETSNPDLQASDLIDATQNLDGLVAVSGAVKTCAVNLSKMSNDLRLMSSGPRCGFSEINLPPRQNGSSIMPGKVNPVIPEVVSQVAFNIIGNDVTVTMAAEAGQLELNAFEPIIFYNLIQSVETLTYAVHTFVDNCVTGITANRERCRDMVEHSVGIITALCPHVGYEKAAEVAKRAIETGAPVRRLILEEGLLDEAALDKILDPYSMTEPGISGKELLEG